MIQSGIQQMALWCSALQHLKWRYPKLNLQCWFRCLDITIHQILEPELVFKAASMLSAGMLSVPVWKVNLEFGSWSSFLVNQSSAFFLRSWYYWISAFSSLISCWRKLQMEAVRFPWFVFLKLTLQITHELWLMSCWITDLIF